MDGHVKAVLNCPYYASIFTDHRRSQHSVIERSIQSSQVCVLSAKSEPFLRRVKEQDTGDPDPMIWQPRYTTNCQLGVALIKKKFNLKLHSFFFFF